MKQPSQAAKNLAKKKAGENKEPISSSGKTRQYYGSRQEPGHAGMFGVNAGYYDADNKGVSATRGRAIQARAKGIQRSSGSGPIESSQMATHYENNKIGSVVPAKQQTSSRAAVNAANSSVRPKPALNPKAAAERDKIKKARQRGDMGRGAGSSQGF